MSTSSTQPQQEASLKLTRSFRAPRARVFQAWTDPEELRKWWQLGRGWKLTVAEVDLRVGGKYRIGLSSTENSSRHHVTGTFREVSAPERLVYTWHVEDSKSKDDSVVTVEFLDKGSSTDVVLKHDRLAGKESRQNTYDGWLIVLDGLARLLG
jgi:uncharacterized protein YndB with AHSA1/START domain